MHPGLAAGPDATVLTHHRSFGMEAAARKDFCDQPWTHWRHAMLAKRSVPDPDLLEEVTQTGVTRCAMP